MVGDLVFSRKKEQGDLVPNEIDDDFAAQREKTRRELQNLGLTEEQISTIENALDELLSALADETFDLEDE